MLTLNSAILRGLRVELKNPKFQEKEKRKCRLFEVFGKAEKLRALPITKRIRTIIPPVLKSCVTIKRDNPRQVLEEESIFHRKSRESGKKYDVGT